jgi:hypothetical protein
LILSKGDPAQARGTGPEQVDLTWGFIMDWLRRAVLDSRHVNYINALIESPLPSSEPRTE